ncbi:MAG: hypothetical protein WCV62_02730 [Candidatus Peribacteraceae bacterium]|jgi:hypothetical protein
MPNTPRSSHEEDILAAIALGSDDLDCPDFPLFALDSGIDGQQITDGMTIDYHLHLVSERLQELSDPHATLQQADLAYMDEHIRVLQNELAKDGKILLSGPCEQVGSPDQKQRLRAILDRRDVIAEQLERCLHCPHREGHQE